MTICEDGSGTVSSVSAGKQRRLDADNSLHHADVAANFSVSYPNQKRES